MAKGKKPEYVARAKDDKGNWFQLGAAWEFDLQDGGTGIGVRLQSIPLNWDGSFSLMPVKDE